MHAGQCLTPGLTVATSHCRSSVRLAAVGGPAVGTAFGQNAKPMLRTIGIQRECLTGVAGVMKLPFSLEC